MILDTWWINWREENDTLRPTVIRTSLLTFVQLQSFVIETKIRNRIYDDNTLCLLGYRQHYMHIF